MPYPRNTATAIQFLNPGKDPLDDFSVSSSQGVISIDHADGLVGGIPTEQQVNDAVNDVTLIDHGDGPENFSSWFSKNGGDVNLTRRRRAKQEVDGSTPLSVAQRAEMGERNKRDNYLVTRILELQEDLQAIKATSGGAENIRNAIRPSYLATQTRPRADARSDLKDEIDSGGSDN